MLLWCSVVITGELFKCPSESLSMVWLLASVGFSVIRIHQTKSLVHPYILERFPWENGYLFFSNSQSFYWLISKEALVSKPETDALWKRVSYSICMLYMDCVAIQHKHNPRLLSVHLLLTRCLVASIGRDRAQGQLCEPLQRAPLSHPEQEEMDVVLGCVLGQELKGCGAALCCQTRC